MPGNGAVCEPDDARLSAQSKTRCALRTSRDLEHVAVIKGVARIPDPSDWNLFPIPKLVIKAQSRGWCQVTQDPAR